MSDSTPTLNTEASNEARLSQIRERLEKATPGPWSACGVAEPELDYTHGAIASARHRHGACSCGFVWSTAIDEPVLEVIGGAWGDRWPAIRKNEDGQLEAYQERSDYGEIAREQQAANMKFIERAPEDIAFLLALIGGPLT